MPRDYLQNMVKVYTASTTLNLGDRNGDEDVDMLEAENSGAHDGKSLADEFGGEFGESYAEEVGVSMRSTRTRSMASRIGRTMTVGIQGAPTTPITTRLVVQPSPTAERAHADCCDWYYLHERDKLAPRYLIEGNGRVVASIHRAELWVVFIWCIGPCFVLPSCPVDDHWLQSIQSVRYFV